MGSHQASQLSCADTGKLQMHFIKPALKRFPVTRYLVRRVTRYLDQYAEAKLDHYLRHPLKFQPNGEFEDEDIFIIGYPKSGNTWFHNLMVGLIFGFPQQIMSEALVREFIPAIHTNLRYYRRYITPMLFSCIDYPRPQYKRVVFLLRDGRDVMVSYRHHMMAIKGQDVDLMEMLQGEPGLGYGKWHEFVEAWLANPYNAQMLIIKYEDLLSDGIAQLTRFCDFFGLQRDRCLIESVIAANDFSHMREREARQGVLNPRWDKDKFFVRRGQVGSYIDEMPPEVVATFMRDAAQTLKKCGYN